MSLAPGVEPRRWEIFGAANASALANFIRFGRLPGSGVCSDESATAAPAKGAEGYGEAAPWEGHSTVAMFISARAPRLGMAWLSGLFKS